MEKSKIRHKSDSPSLSDAKSLRAFIQIRVPFWGVDGTVTWEGECGLHRLKFMWTPHPMLCYLVMNTYL